MPVPNAQMSTFELPRSLSMANATTLSSLSAPPVTSSSVFPIRSFTLEEQLTSVDDVQYLGFSEWLSSTTDVPQLAFYAHLSKYSS